MVSTPLKNISQLGLLFQYMEQKKHVPIKDDTKATHKPIILRYLEQFQATAEAMSYQRGATDWKADPGLLPATALRARHPAQRGLLRGGVSKGSRETLQFQNMPPAAWRTW